MTTPSPAFPRYFKSRRYNLPPIRFDDEGFAIYFNGNRSHFFTFKRVTEDNDYWLEIPKPEAIALLTARNGGGE